MGRSVHIIGNGDNAVWYQQEKRKGLKLGCNVPPFEIPDMYATCIVDFKMMAHIKKGEVKPPGEWICGIRPHIFCQQNPTFHVQISSRIKEFFLDKPKYAKNYTDFSCGHFAGWYAAQKINPDRIHLWGFDSVFDFNLRSYTDLVLHSDRGNMNNNRLSNNWRPIWEHMMKDKSDIEWIWHHKHDAIKIKLPENARIEIHKK